VAEGGDLVSARLHWRRHCPGDHLARAADLTLEEDGVLLRLLDWYWMNGPIPADVERAMKFIRAPKNKANMVREILNRFFRLDIDSGNYVSLDLSEERAHAEDVVEQRKSAGRDGGLAKARANASAEVKQKGSDQIRSDQIRSHQIRTDLKITLGRVALPYLVAIRMRVRNGRPEVTTDGPSPLSA